MFYVRHTEGVVCSIVWVLCSVVVYCVSWGHYLKWDIYYEPDGNCWREEELCIDRCVATDWATLDVFFLSVNANPSAPAEYQAQFDDKRDCEWNRINQRCCLCLIAEEDTHESQSDCIHAKERIYDRISWWPDASCYQSTCNHQIETDSNESQCRSSDHTC